MWPPSDDGADEALATGVPEPAGPAKPSVSSGWELAERAKRRAEVLPAVKRLADAIEQSKQEYRNRMTFIRWPQQ